MSPEEAKIREKVWERMRKRMGKKVVEEQEAFLEAQWEWAKELGMIDPEMDLQM